MRPSKIFNIIIRIRGMLAEETWLNARKFVAMSQRSAFKSSWGKKEKREKNTSAKEHVYAMVRCRKERSSKNINVWLMAFIGDSIPWKSSNASVFASRRRNLCKSSYVTAHYTSLKAALMRTRGVVVVTCPLEIGDDILSRVLQRSSAKVMREGRAGERHARNTVFPSRLQLNATLILRWHRMQFSCIRRINLRIIWSHVTSKETVQCHC